MFSSNTSQVSNDKLFVEDAFSTFVYTGNGSTQTITNGIDLAGKGGLVWIKARSAAGADHNLFDTSRGATKRLFTNTADAEITTSGTLNSFSSSGFSLGSQSSVNQNTTTYASWTFREAPKFFDVVTYTGNGASNRSISHALGVAPGVMIIKRYDSTGQWVTYHRSLGNGNALVLESTSAQFATNTFGYTTPDATTFTVNDYNNINGATYVAYLFAHDTTSDGIIQCGSVYTDGSATEVNLGWEPQWVLLKRSSGTGSWLVSDNMRGFPASGSPQYLEANSSSSEFTLSTVANLTSTGFKIDGFGLGTYIYIAIRRGPMRTPTTGTSVFMPVLRTGTSANANVTSGFAPDFLFVRNVNNNVSAVNTVNDKLRGPSVYLQTQGTNSDTAYASDGLLSFNNNGVTFGADQTSWYYNYFFSGANYINYFFRRAPSFFDEVCYTGTGSARTVSHNLGVVPELMIVKCRSNSSTSWWVYHSALGATKYLELNSPFGEGTASSIWNNTAPTSTAFTVGTLSSINNSGYTFAAYLFASCPGVSKVFSFTGNGSSQTINCGFSGGARFILIKRTDSTGNWVVFDSARGIVSGNDPSLLLNSTAAETNYDDIDPDSSGFVVNQSTNNLNVNGATYIGLAIS